MNVLYIGRGCRDILTGGQRYLSEVFTSLTKADINLQFLLYEDAPASARRQPLLVNIWYARRFFQTYRKSTNVVLEDYSGRLELFLFNCFLRLVTRARIVLIVQGFYFFSLRSAKNRFIDRAITRILFKTCHAIVASSKAAAKVIINMGVPRSRSFVIYPGVGSEFVDRQPDPLRCRQREGSHLLFVGRFAPVKGVEYLVKALALLSGETVQLIVAGDTGYYAGYQAQIAELIQALDLVRCVTYRGVVKDPRLLVQIYEEADIFVLPSLWETHSVALVEAMCRGLPVVATNVGGIPEKVTDGVEGFLVAPRDPEALAAAIKKLIDDPELRREMGQKSFEKSKEFSHRTWEQVGRDFCELLMSEFG